MGLKGYRLCVMGQLDSTCRATPRVHDPVHQKLRVILVVALQVEFERQTLKPVFSLDSL